MSPSQQQPITSALIWFQLWDSSTDQPFKGTTVSSIIRSSLVVPVIDQFRKAVKEQDNQENEAAVLKGLKSSQLLVYKNKQALDNKEEALEEDALVTDLGKSKGEALIVLVPPSLDYTNQASIISPSFHPSQPLRLLPCGIPFYNDILNATERDGWISFGPDIPSTSLNSLYIRESYKTIASSIKPGINKTIITGTPGIGKSLFMIYLLWKLVRAGKRVLFVYHPRTIYYDGQGGVFQVPSNALLCDDVSFWNADLWCLFDAKGKNERDLSAFPYGDCTFVLSMSPRREMINDFKKPPPPQFFYMPLWNESELETIASSFPDAIDWRERFRILGGVPRHVLEVASDNPTKLLEAACKQCELDDYIKITGPDSIITDKSKVVHSLVHIISTHPYTHSSVSYASETALNIIAQTKSRDLKHRIHQLLESCHGSPLTASLCGYLFESYAIKLLEKGGDFICRRLVHGNKKSKPDDTILTIPPSTKEVVDKVEVGQVVNRLYIPKSKNYAAIDAWIPGIGAFQITVGKTHDIKGGAKRDLALLGTSGNKLYWLLPPLHFDTFTKKNPKDIDQYVVKIPYPPPTDLIAE